MTADKGRPHQPSSRRDLADNDVAANRPDIDRVPCLDFGGVENDLRLFSQLIDRDTENPEDVSGGAALSVNGGGNRRLTGEPGRDANLRRAHVRAARQGVQHFRGFVGPVSLLIFPSRVFFLGLHDDQEPSR